MPVAARVNPKNVFAPDEWAPLAARSSWKGLALVAHCWLVIAAACSATGLVLALYGTRMTSAPRTASIASNIAAVEGFID